MSEDTHDDEEPLDRDNLPDGMSIMSVNSEEMAYLQEYWEMRKPGDLLGWAMRILYDLTRVDEAGWLLMLQKGVINPDTKTVVPDAAYKVAAFQLEWLLPDGEGGYRRLPLERLEKLMRRKPDVGEGI